MELYLFFPLYVPFYVLYFLLLILLLLLLVLLFFFFVVHTVPACGCFARGV